MGFFTIPMAHKVGKTGRVIATDIQPKMLESLRRRAKEAGVEKRIETRLVQVESLELGDLIAAVDFVLVFAVVHEMLSVDLFFRQVSTALKTGGLLLLAEPQGHVDASEWKRELESANAAGLDTSVIRGFGAAGRRCSVRPSSPEDPQVRHAVKKWPSPPMNRAES